MQITWLIILLTICGAACAQNGQLDTSFASGGVRIAQVAIAGASVLQSTAQSWI